MESQEQRIERIFQGAVEVGPGEERARILASECGGDEPLRRRLEVLIRAHEAAGGFMDPAHVPSAPGAGGDGAGRCESVRVGSRIGHFRILGKVGEGAGAVVYLAEQMEPVRRPVALKLLKPGAHLGWLRARFEAEQQALALLDHPNIAPLYDAGATAQGLPYLVLEWIPGPSITSYTDAGCLSLRARLELFLQVCAGVAHAHAHGVIHRDLKPANILVPEYGGRPVPKIIDFGVAKGVGGGLDLDPGPELERSVLGTPSYMSPEQAQGRSEGVDVRADVFALGAVLYELLTGWPPRAAVTEGIGGSAGADSAAGAMAFQPPSVRVEACESEVRAELATRRRTTAAALATALRGDLDAIVTKALQADREDRYATVQALIDDLRRYLEYREVSVHRSSWAKSVRGWTRRHRLVAACGGVVAGVLLGAVSSTVMQGLQSKMSDRAARRAQLAVVREDPGRLRSHWLTEQGASALKKGDAAEAIFWFARAGQEAPAGSSERQLCLRRLRMLTQRVAVPLRALQLAGSLASLEFSPDARYLGAVERDGPCTVWDWGADLVLEWSRGVDPVRAIDWGPVAGQIALGYAGGAVEIRVAATGEIVRRLETGEPVTALRFSPGGGVLAAAGRTLRLWSRGAADWRDAGFAHPAAVYGLGFSADGGNLVTACRDGQARVFSVEAGGPISGALLGGFPHAEGFGSTDKLPCCEASLIETDPAVPLVLGGGSGLLTWTGVGELSVWGVGDHSLVGRLGGTCHSTRLVQGPDGRWVAAALQRGAAEFRSAADVLAAPAAQLSHQERVCDIAFEPGGDRVLTVSADRTARVWRLPGAQPLYSPLAHSREVVHGAFAVNGDWVATGQLDGQIRVWRLPAAEGQPEVHELDAPGAWSVESNGADRWLWFSQKASGGWVLLLPPEGAAPEWTRLEAPGPIESAAWSESGGLLALVMRLEGDALGRLEVRAVGEVQAPRCCLDLPFLPSRVAWHAAEDRLAVGEDRGGLWLIHLREPLELVRSGVASAEDGEEEGLGFSADGRQLVRWWADGRFAVWDSETGSLRCEMKYAAGRGGRLTLSPSDARILTTDPEGISVVRSLEDGRGLGRGFRHVGGVVAQGFSPDGRWVVTSGHDGRILVRDGMTGELACPPIAQADEAFGFRFCSDGSWLASVCRNGDFQVWDTRSGAELLPAWGAGEPLFAMGLTADDRRAVLLGAGSRLWVWDLRRMSEVPELSLEAMALFGELVSGLAEREDRAEAMSSAEWRERMKRWQALPPVQL